jgi:hypothetical protein
MAGDPEDDETLYDSPEGGTAPSEGDSAASGTGDGGSDSHTGTPNPSVATTSASGGSTSSVDKESNNKTGDSNSRLGTPSTDGTAPGKNSTPSYDTSKPGADGGSKPAAVTKPSGTSSSGGGADGTNSHIETPGPGGTPAMGSPGQMAASAPTAPTYKAPDRTKLQQDEDLYAKDSKAIDRNDPSVKVGWKDRLLGGLAGFLSQDAAGGAAVTNRRYNAAEANRQKSLEGDKGRIANDRSDMSDEDALYEHQRQQFADQDTQFNTAATGAQRARENQRQDTQDANNQRHQAFEEGRETTGDAREQKKLSDEELYHTDDLNLRKQELGQTGAYQRGELSLRRRELDDTEARDAVNTPGSPANQRKRQEDANKLLQQRNQVISTIQNGDPTKGTRGFAQNLQIAQNGTNPETNEPFNNPKEKDEYIAQLKMQHKAQLDDAEGQYSQSMNTLGFQTVPVQHDENGVALNDSSGKPLVPQQQGQPAQPGSGQQAVTQAQPGVLNGQTDLEPSGAPTPPPQASAPRQAPVAPQQRPPQPLTVSKVMNPATKKPYSLGDPAMTPDGRHAFVRFVFPDGKILLTNNRALVGKPPQQQQTAP